MHVFHVFYKSEKKHVFYVFFIRKSMFLSSMQRTRLQHGNTAVQKKTTTNNLILRKQQGDDAALNCKKLLEIRRPEYNSYY